jgi:hypothetical protein
MEAVEDVQEPAAPEPIQQGKYALYETPDGGRHLVYQPEGEAEAQHLPIPPMVVALAQEALTTGKVNPLAAIKVLVSMGKT